MNFLPIGMHIDDTLKDLSTLLAIMYFPDYKTNEDSKEKIVKFSDYIFFNTIKNGCLRSQNGDTISLPRVVVEFESGLSLKDINDIAIRERQAMIAGQMFMALHTQIVVYEKRLKTNPSLAKDSRSKPSINTARGLVILWNENDAKELVTRRSTREAWKEFSSVAHLWAGINIFQQHWENHLQSYFAENPIAFQNLIFGNYISLLENAKFLLSEVRPHVPHSKTKSIINEESLWWLHPEIDACVLDISKDKFSYPKHIDSLVQMMRTDLPEARKRIADQKRAS